MERSCCMRRRGRRQFWDEYKFAVILGQDESITLATTLSGVQCAMRFDHRTPAQILEFETSISRGGVWIPRRTDHYAKRIQLRSATTVDVLREVAATIRHSGNLNVWWREEDGTVWWSRNPSPQEDRLVKEGVCASDDEIRRRVHGVRRVQRVLIHVEGIPDTRRDPRWFEIFPGRLLFDPVPQ
jgi:hypothetical protein